MTTHAHFAGEFGSQKMTKTLEKDPAYRAARAEHFAREAHAAKDAHGKSAGAERAKQALVVAHAATMASKHARAAAKLAPGSEHANNAVIASRAAKFAHDSLVKAEKPITSTETRTVAAKKATKAAFDKTKIASQNPTKQTQSVAAVAHRRAADANKGDVKTVALHVRQADHHQHRADTIDLDGTKE